MPYPTSCTAAAKHLFRHLHEADTLRKNPLVAHFFTVAAGGSPTKTVPGRSPDGAARSSI